MSEYVLRSSRARAFCSCVSLAAEALACVSCDAGFVLFDDRLGDDRFALGDAAGFGPSKMLWSAAARFLGAAFLGAAFFAECYRYRRCSATADPTARKNLEVLAVLTNASCVAVCLSSLLRRRHLCSLLSAASSLAGYCCRGWQR